MTITAESLMGTGVPSGALVKIAESLNSEVASEATARTAAITATGVVTTATTRTTAEGLVAAGTLIGDGTALTSFVNVVATTASGTGVVLPDAPVGVTIRIQNNGANTLNVWPPNGSGTLNGASAGTAITVATTVGVDCTRMSSTNWLCVRLGALET